MPMTPSGGGQKDYYSVYHPILGNPQQITLRNSQLIICGSTDKENSCSHELHIHESISFYNILISTN